MECDDGLDLAGLSVEQFIAQFDDTDFSARASEESIDFNIRVADLCEAAELDENEDLSDVDWEKVDWEHVAANWDHDDLKPTCTTKSLCEQVEKNKRRRMNEVERLHKYSWKRLPMKSEGKRVRYKYVHIDGSTVTSLRAALGKCGK